MNFKFKELNNIGKLMIIIGTLTLVPLGMIPFYPQDSVYSMSFIIPSLFSILGGLVVGKKFKSQSTEIDFQYMNQTGSLIVLFAWFYGFFMGAFPFYLSNQLTFIQSLYEAVSGWTTTGLSVMDVSVTPPIFLFYRSFMQFCGGLGFMMMMIMLIQGKESMSLYNAEGHTDRLMPNIKNTAQVIFKMYSFFLAIGTMVYILFGMPILDSLLHAMSALSTGGFSTEVNSIGAYESLKIEAVTIMLMVIGTTNFAVLLLLARRKFSQLIKVSELRFFGLILLVFLPLLSFSIFSEMYMGLGESFRHALFNIVSALSTTGYSTTTYDTWPAAGIGIMIIMMVIGGGLGSTAGGLKLTRVYLMLRILGLNIKKRVSSTRRVNTAYYQTAQGKQEIDTSLMTDTIGFITFYILILLTGGILITWTSGATLTEAMFEFASSLGTVGLSIGLTGPSTDYGTLIIQMFGMILGRLEIFIILVGAYSGMYSLKHKFRKTA
ncbi:TrkH family potassium uptake protein [Marinilactibacillus psychrotolerans]|uniref:Potassium transporter n=1 Tax=Marinilactibacillus psychrotolerans TaxID=191770 RepID=A0AAV3WR55_9LACT|nr:potassium transporter TrkG [Marinilactibacillus psychrotolerans]GEL66757.1 potassium transporter [Marinilactibacillus psychrotolerans]GEQ35796.1 potassium transporter [Marinilactibacillus psychrotolerans]SDC33063.1 trk system potassium uptake protein TrkH [Marinilactibacillus psychrotolerans]